jgi:hypothetical protein
MIKNLGVPDRTIRLIIGVVVLGLFGALTPPWRYLTLLGLIPLGTALTGSCPIYTLLGFSTRSKESAAKP